MSTTSLSRLRGSDRMPSEATSAKANLARLKSHVDRLFPGDEVRPRTRRSLLWGIVAVALGSVVSLARTTGAGPFQTIWEEDARDLLTDALMQPGAFNLVKPYVGYFQIGPRILAEIAAFFPISWAAAILSIQAAIISALLALAVYVASGTHLRHPLARFMVAAPMLFSPTAENIVSEIYNRPATLQFFIAYAMFWLILWVPATRAGRITQVATVAISAFSTFLVVIYIPLALLRLWTRRDRISLALVSLLSAGAALQVIGLAVGLTNRDFTTPKYQALWAVKNFIFWAVPHSMLGWEHAWMIGDDVFPIRANIILRVALAWLIIAGAVIIALRRLTRPLWLLAIVAAAHSAALACMTIMANGMITQRYLLPVELLLFTALFALLIPAGGPNRLRAHAPIALLACFVLVVSAFNYRHTNTWRNQGPIWTDQVKAAALSCRAPERREVAVRSGPAPYFSIVVVPCHVFRVPRWCQPPFCEEIGPGHPAISGNKERE